VCLVERPLPVPWAGHPVTDLELEGLARVVAVTRLGEAMLPASDLVAQEGDVLWLAVAGSEIDDLDRRLLGGPGRGGR
jgi:Trk K+ transport system NAD-binding subunit